jgi:hypothetical protein
MFTIVTNDVSIVGVGLYMEGGKNCFKSQVFCVRGCIQNFSYWVDNEINNMNDNYNKHSLRSNTKVRGGKTH